MSPGSSPQQVENLSAKGRRTRDRLVYGARLAFEAKGSYVDTRISDIAEAAGVAYGSFYTYFETKEQLFYELAHEVVQEMFAEGTSRYRGDDPILRIDASNRQFLDSYRRHAAMMVIIEQAAAMYPEFRTLRRRLREGFVERIAANLQRLADQGQIEASVNCSIAAHALVSMTDNFGYLWFVLGETFEPEQAFHTLTRLWANSLGLAGAVPGDQLRSVAATPRQLATSD